MSGIYLTVWDNNVWNEVLSPTKGGWPHITVVYCGRKNIDVSTLKDVSCKIFNESVLKKITLEDAYVNKFFEEETQKMRYDCLIKISQQDFIVDLRNRFINNLKNVDKFSMGDPHITCGIFYTEQEAQEKCDQINKLLVRDVIINGVCID